MATETWITHDGKRCRLQEMNVFHLQGTLKKLKAHEEMFQRVCAGEDPMGLRAYLDNEINQVLAPPLTPEELLERTTSWIQVIEQELLNKQQAEIHGFR